MKPTRQKQPASPAPTAAAPPPVARKVAGFIKLLEPHRLDIMDAEEGQALRQLDAEFAELEVRLAEVSRDAAVRRWKQSRDAAAADPSGENLSALGETKFEALTRARQSSTAFKGHRRVLAAKAGPLVLSVVKKSIAIIEAELHTAEKTERQFADLLGLTFAASPALEAGRIGLDRLRDFQTGIGVRPRRALANLIEL